MTPTPPPPGPTRMGLAAPALLALVLGSCGATVEPSLPEPVDDDSSWAFSVPEHPESSRPALDLRPLNEAEAGRSGFVKLTPDGNGFALGDGSPARFWAIGSEVYKLPPEAIAAHVRFLARIGVNMVRLHAQIAPKGPGSKPLDVDEAEVDGIWRFVAEAKKQGIYTTISPYWANAKDAARWGIAGYGTGDLWGLLFFDPALQKAYKAWAKALYARPNPYTKIPLSKEPAVAIIQVQNEDSLFFWTAMMMKKPQTDRLADRFAKWLASRYGSLDAAFKAWPGANQAGDDPAHGKVALVGIYPMTQRQTGGMAARVADEVAFIAATQRDFYAMIAAYYRDDLGCQQLINASNWKTADQGRMDDIERWTYTSSEVIAVNRYFNGIHLGPQVGWRIDPGDKFTQKSALMDPRSLSVNLKQVVGHPTIVTEGSWVAPLGYQSEGPFLVSVYQSLTGVDAFYWFSAPTPGYTEDPFFAFQKVNGQQPILKWSAEVPAILGGFPAAALLFRKGMVKQGEPIVHEERTLASLWARDAPSIAEDPSFDPNRDQGVRAAGSQAPTIADPLAFLVGPVEVKYDGDPTRTRIGDTAKFIDRDKKLIRSNTGEIKLDYGRGFCTVDAPSAQGACGFLDKAGPLRFRDVAIDSANPYASVLVVAMDDQPLSASKKVLVQVVTAGRPAGWEARPVEFAPEAKAAKVAGFEVVKTGSPPWMMANTALGLAIKNPNLARAARVDAAGFKAGNVRVNRTKGGLNLTLPPDTMYVILE